MKILKKIFKTIRLALIGLAWTYVFILFSNSELIVAWNFNMLSKRSWKTISSFWQAGGTIKTAKDYLFLLNLLLIPVLWGWGWHFLNRQNYTSILIWPYTVYNNHVIKRLKKSSSVSLKNIGASGNDVEIIKNEINSIKPEKVKEVSDIRKNIQEKINSLNKQ